MWLSIDWDFFQEERPEWDWGHADNPIFQNLAWLTRPFFMGKDITPITHPDAHEPKARSFWMEVARSWDFSKCQRPMLADSHAKALPFFFSIDSPADELWNFDAHHDLGYVGLRTLTKWAKEGKAEAGSWAFVLLSRLKKLKYLHIHPVWKNKDAEPTGWMGDKSIKKRVVQLTADKLDMDERVEITALFIAKSAPWSPPWNDWEFKKFVGKAEKRTGLSPRDDEVVVAPRVWDEEAAQRQNELFLKMSDRYERRLERRRQRGNTEG